VADKINFSTFFDFSDESQVQAFLQGGQDIITAYNQILGEAKKNKSDLSKATKQLVKALEEEEKVLQRANDATKAGQETIAKSAANTSKFTNELKKQREEEAKLNKEITDLRKKVDELNASMDKAKTVTDATTKSNKAAAGSVDELKQKVTEAKKAYEALGDSVDPIEKSKALENYAKLKQELDQVNKSTADAAKGNIIAKGSYNELQREVDQLHKEYKNLPDALGKNKVKAEELRKTLGQKRQTLKDLDAQMNLHNRNVGNYSESLKEAALNSNLFGGKISQAAQGLQGLQNGLKTASGGFSSLRAAIISTGIGALLIALGALVALFTKTDAGGEKVEQMMAGIGAVVEFLIGKLVKLGEILVETFSNPKQALIDFGNALKDFILARITSVSNGLYGLGKAMELLFTGKFKEAAKAAKNALIELDSGINPVTIGMNLMTKAFAGAADEATRLFKAAAALKAELQALEDVERVYGITSLKNKGIIEQLSATAKDRTKSEAERLDNLDRAIALERSNTEEELALARKRFDIILRENQLKTDLSKDEVRAFTESLDAYEKYADRRGTLSDDDLDKQAEAQKKLIQLEQDSLLKIQQLQNKRSVFVQDLLDEIQKRNKKISEGMDSKGIEKQLDATKKVVSKSVDDQIKIRADGYAKELEDWKEKEKKKTEIEREQAELRKELEQQTQDLITEASALPFEINKQRRQEELSDLQEQRAYDLELAGDNAKQKDIINKEYDKRERKIKRDIAKADRNKALFDIAINTAVGISKAIPNVPLIIFSTAVGLAQAALVLAKPIPQYAVGTKNAPEGWAIVDEKGPELRESKGKLYMGSNRGPRLTYLNRGDKIHTAEETKKILEGKTASDMLLSYQLGAYKLSGVKQDPTIDYEKLSRPIVDAINRKPAASLHVDKSGIRAFYRKGNSEVEYLNSRFGINI
jgi:hypothetical protein